MTLETEISDVFDDVCSHFSTDEIVFHVSVAGLQCLESNRLFCTCQNCMTISDDFAANLECCQLRNVRLKHFFNRLPPACFISDPEFFDGGEFVPFSDSESSCSVVMDTMFGDEFDDSDSETETETETCQLWNLNFGWLHETTPQEDSNLLCGMSAAGNTDLSGTLHELYTVQLPLSVVCKV